MAYLLLICLLICRSGWNAALAIKHGGRNHGSPAVTKTAWTLLRNTSGICSANQPIEDTFCRPWRAVCCPTQVATLTTSVSSTDGQCSGQTDATLAGPYRLRGNPNALLMNLPCGSGADYTTRTCCPFSGLMESLTQQKGTPSASCWTCIPWTETGKPSPTQRSIPTRICPGRTGRSWRTKASPPRRRRYRRRSAACVHSHPWHRSTMLRCLAAWNQCPLRGSESATLTVSVQRCYLLPLGVCARSYSLHSCGLEADLGQGAVLWQTTAAIGKLGHRTVTASNARRRLMDIRPG